jgi:hypothetical protein
MICGLKMQDRIKRKIRSIAIMGRVMSFMFTSKSNELVGILQIQHQIPITTCSSVIS